MAATNKCLAQGNKTRTRAKATQKRVALQPTQRNEAMQEYRRCTIAAKQGEWKVNKLLVTTAVVLSLAANSANARDMFDCDADHVQDTLQRVIHARKVISTKNVPSKDVSEERWCLGQVITSRGSFAEFAFTLRWTSASEGRYWLQTEGGHYY
jgi:hypothetical protein